jgi:hypothetical protein
VTVNNHLTRLRDCAGNSGTKHECIESHFEKLNKVLTG